jgi:dCMP deaminase
MSDFAFNDNRLWDWAVGLAKHASILSKDPSTKVGAAIFDDKRRVVSVAYNGFPRGVEDSEYRLQNREIKYKMVLHAEQNAMAFATAPLHGSTLFCTHPCCTQCAAMAIQRGVKHVCWPEPSAEFLERWSLDAELSNAMFQEAGVQVHVK